MCSKRRVSVGNYGACRVGLKVCKKSLLDAMAMNCHVATEKLDPKEHREFRSGAGICPYMTEQRFDIALSMKEIMREEAGPTIHVSVDADWAGDPKTRCSTSGGVLAICPCVTVIHWSVTQATVSLSSAEPEA